jgi:hypothetical protein
MGTCFGKFSKSGKFKLTITCLDWLAKYAKYKVCAGPGCIGVLAVRASGTVEVDRWSMPSKKAGVISKQQGRRTEKGEPFANSLLQIGVGETTWRTPLLVR